MNRQHLLHICAPVQQCLVAPKSSASISNTNSRCSGTSAIFWQRVSIGRVYTGPMSNFSLISLSVGRVKSESCCAELIETWRFTQLLSSMFVRPSYDHSLRDGSIVPSYDSHLQICWNGYDVAQYAKYLSCSSLKRLIVGSGRLPVRREHAWATTPRLQDGHDRVRPRRVDVRPAGEGISGDVCAGGAEAGGAGGGDMQRAVRGARRGQALAVEAGGVPAEDLPDFAQHRVRRLRHLRGRAEAAPVRAGGVPGPQPDGKRGDGGEAARDIPVRRGAAAHAVFGAPAVRGGTAGALGGKGAAVPVRDGPRGRVLQVQGPHAGPVGAGGQRLPAAALHRGGRRGRGAAGFVGPPRAALGRRVAVQRRRGRGGHGGCPQWRLRAAAR